ncbi:unnamed protein product, partial [Rotaria sp. Silwood1]
MPSSPSVLQRSITAFTTPKKSKLSDITKNKIKELEARWICEDMRPIAVVDDPGFRRLAQELVSIGKLILIRMNSMSFSILLGAQHGNVDVDEILRGAKTISSHISDLATTERSRIRTLLINLLENGTLCLCPDLWTDKHRQVHYLGITASFVDDAYGLYNIDLCCYPFPSVAKTAENIITVLQSALEPFGIIDLSQVFFVSDRGSNFVKALTHFFVIWCFAHRLNNVLKLCFFTAATKEEKRKAMDNTQLSDDSDEDFDLVIKSDCVQDLPKKALYVLKVVFECKALVKY